MSSVWFVKLNGRISREEFDHIAETVGIRYVSNVVGGNVYWDTRVAGDEFGGGVEIYFGDRRNQSHVTELNFRTAGFSGYEAMKRSVLDLGRHIEFRDISGEWFDEVSKFDISTGNYKPFPYSPDVFRVLEPIEMENKDGVYQPKTD